MSADADRWDARYRDGSAPVALDPPEIVATMLGDLAPGARVLDVACGWGDAGLFLATHGAIATFVDVSAVALEAVITRAGVLDVDVSTVVADLTTGAIPEGKWDAIICTHYLDRDLLAQLGKALASGGRLVCAIATVTNLERHERPSARFLLQPGELATLVPELTIVHASEEWRANNVHEAWLVATVLP